jgi:hypothetical protein
MSSIVQWVPAMLQASSHMAARRDARLNARLLEEQARATAAAAAQDEAAHRRAARAAIGRQAAAQAEAGIGVTGTGGLLLDQSAILAELDALNIRYGGQLRAKGLLAESLAMRSRARQSGLLAGAALLQGTSRALTRQRILEG